MACNKEPQESSELEFLKRQLEIHRRNLRILEAQAALHGPLNAPLKIQNSIELEKEKIACLERKIAELEGGLSPIIKKEPGRKAGCIIWWGSLSDGTKAACIGLIGVVMAAIIGLIGTLGVPIITECV